MKKVVCFSSILLIALQTLSLAASAQQADPVEEDWLYQADNKVTASRVLAELQWTDALLARLEKLPNAPNLTAQKKKLDALRPQLEALRAFASQEKPSGSGAQETELALPPKATAYTFSLWMRSPKSVSDIAGTGLDAGDFLLVLNDGPVRVHHTTNAGNNAFDGTKNVADGKWHHVAQIVQAGEISLYVDGKKEFTHKLAGKVTLGTKKVLLNSLGNSRRDYIFRGELKQPKLLARALSEKEITELAANQPAAAVKITKAAPSPGQPSELYLALRRIKRELMFADPAVDFDKLLFVDVPVYDALNHESMHRVFPQAQNNDGRLLTLEGLRPDGKLTDLVGKPGMFWRPTLSFDGKKVLFCMKPEKEHVFHLYETSLDSPQKNIRQITDGKYDDLDPIYLPNGDYLFLSNRGNSYSRCAVAHPSYVVSRCDRDGKNLYILSTSNEPEYTPVLLPSGQVLYTRWEYTDKELFRIQSLWTMNPDGTNVSAYWGNQSVWPDMLVEARPIPGSRRVIFSGQGHHCIISGSLGKIDQTAGLNYPDGLTKVTPELPWAEVGNGPTHVTETDDYHASGQFMGYRCPYPLSDELFLVSAIRSDGKRRHVGSSARPKTRFALYLMDIRGNKELIYQGKEDILYAMPVRPRTKPPVIPDRREWPGLASDDAKGERLKPGVLYSNNVFEGLDERVRKEAKYVQIIEQDYTTFTFGTKCQMPDHTGRKEMRNHQHAGPPLTITSNDGVKYILGTVPIESDGSFAVEIPPSRQVHFQLLDAEKRAILLMRSFTQVMPGEQRGCVGCHEGDGKTPQPNVSSIAMRKGAVRPTPPSWGPQYHLGYKTDIQPILDKYCGKCHQGDGVAKKKLDLTFRPCPEFGSYTEPYITLTLGKERRSGGFAYTKKPGPAGCLLPMNAAGGFASSSKDGTLPPFTDMSYNSLLVKNATSGKHGADKNGKGGVKVDALSEEKLVAWVDLLCPYWNEGQIREIPDPDPTAPFYQHIDANPWPKAYPPRTPGVRPYADSPYPQRMQNAPRVNRAYCQDEFPSQAERLAAP